MRNVTGLLEPLQTELHLQSQWSLCMVCYEVFLLGKNDLSSHLYAINKVKLLFVLISQRVGIGALVLSSSSFYDSYCT